MMEVEERVSVRASPTSIKKDERPVVTTWKDAKMIRTQSIRAAVKEIVQMSDVGLDVIKVNLVGKPSTGKTTLALTIAHLVHKMSNIPFAVRMFSKDDLMNFEETLKSLQPANYILIFDDVSFMGAKTSKKQIETVKQAFTEIRHLEGGRDVKIIAIFNFHYTLALDKYLRQSEFQFFTSIGSSELDNTLALVGPKNHKKVTMFQKMWNKAYANGFWMYELNPAKKKIFKYDFRKPFAPILFWNGGSLRHVVFPKREWIDAICPICNLAEKKTKSTVDVNVVMEQLTAQFSTKGIKTAAKQMLKEMGVNTYGKSYIQARRALDRTMEKNNISVEDVALFYNLKPTKTTIKGKKIPVVEETK